MMKLTKTTVLLALVALVLAGSAAAESGHLLVQKTVHNKYQAQQIPLLTEGDEFVVELNVFNVGDGDAHEVSLADGEWPSEAFSVEGETEAAWDVIPAGEKQTLNYTITPTSGQGQIRGFPAKAEYRPTQDGNMVTVHSSMMRSFQIIDKELHERLTATHTTEKYIVGSVMAAAVLIPLLSFLNAKNNLKAKSN
eukprot:TRINITY_DN16512_c0_g1_i2.p1 TRINITY_DN16512_c0_g1~~TRINITY_DN16512_c0_g1_i2.p1  ORF type:complete len:194 (+),score=117.31 TRINITY_DN16512_c0_g1_i2:83-664(+)